MARKLRKPVPEALTAAETLTVDVLAKVDPAFAPFRDFRTSGRHAARVDMGPPGSVSDRRDSDRHRRAHSYQSDAAFPRSRAIGPSRSIFPRQAAIKNTGGPPYRCRR